MPKFHSLLRFLAFSTFCCLALAHTHSHEGGSCHGHSHDTAQAAKYQADGLDEFGNAWVEAKAPQRERTLEETINLWWTAMGSTLLISAAPFFILFFVPLDKGEEYKPFLNILLAFAAGGLLGDSFLHLIPHAIPAEENHGHTHSHDHGGHGHSHNQGHINCNLWVLAGILTFLFIEKWARMMNVGHSHGGDGHTHSHSHGAGDKAKDSDAEEENQEEKSQETEQTKNEKTEAKNAAVSNSWLPEMDIAGYLNLAADFSHNFTDGLAIGASYLAGNTVGIITTITILVHEVPHEIGDFAILINSGCERMTAIYLQSTTAIGALIGTAIGLMMENWGQDAINAILPFTAGGFVYIACCSIMPELLESKYNNPKQVMWELFMLCLGIAMMVVIGWFE